jgi:hypothetical protein
MLRVYSDRTCFLDPAHATPEIPQALIPVLASVFRLDLFPFCLPFVRSDSSDDDSQVEDDLAGKNTSKSEPCKTTLAC